MNKLKKRVLGVIGLIAVVVITVIAYCLPSPDASAEEGITSHTDVISIRVYDKYADVNITTPTNDQVIIGGKTNIEYDYSSLEKVDFVLTFKDEAGGEEVIVWSETIEVEGGIDEVGSKIIENIPFSEGYGKYTLSYHAHGAVPSLDSEGTIDIYHYSTMLVYIGTDENGNPIYDLYYSNDSKNTEINIYDNSGKSIFDRPIVIPSSDDRYSQDGGIEHVNEEIDKVRITIKMPEGIESGVYSASSKAIDADGNEMGPAHTIQFDYEAPAPDVPDTGSFLFGVNVAKSDFLITGLIIFFIVALGAVVLINRRENMSKSKKRR